MEQEQNPMIHWTHSFGYYIQSTSNPSNSCSDTLFWIEKVNQLTNMLISRAIQ